MTTKTGITWSEFSWNPSTGCDRISPGCDSCYAATLAKRLKAMGQPRYQVDGDPRTSGPGFGFTMHIDSIAEPFSWRKPRLVFVNSMSDLFHAKAPASFIAQVWSTMAATPQHTYQVLTKRPERMSRLLGAGGPVTEALNDMEPAWLTAPIEPDEENGRWVHELCPPPNVWVGTTIESNDYANRADALRRTPAAVRFLSLEPMIGPCDEINLDGIDWVIIGGESGPGAREMDLDWALDVMDECAAAGVPVHFKQFGTVAARRLGIGGKGEKWDDPQFPDRFKVREWPKGWQS